MIILTQNHKIKKVKAKSNLLKYDKKSDQIFFINWDPEKTIFAKIKLIHQNNQYLIKPLIWN